MAVVFIIRSIIFIASGKGHGDSDCRGFSIERWKSPQVKKENVLK